MLHHHPAFIHHFSFKQCLALVLLEFHPSFPPFLFQTILQGHFEFQAFLAMGLCLFSGFMPFARAVNILLYSIILYVCVCVSMDLWERIKLEECILSVYDVYLCGRDCRRSETRVLFIIFLID